MLALFIQCQKANFSTNLSSLHKDPADLVRMSFFGKVGAIHSDMTCTSGYQHLKVTSGVSEPSAVLLPGKLPPRGQLSCPHQSRCS